MGVLKNKNRKGNPKGTGRPKGSRNKRTLAMELFCRKVAEEGVMIELKDKNGKILKESFPPLLYKTVSLAHSGDANAAKIVYEYGFGKPMQRTHLSGSVANPVADHTQRVYSMTPQEREKEVAHQQKLHARVKGKVIEIRPKAKAGGRDGKGR